MSALLPRAWQMPATLSPEAQFSRGSIAFMRAHLWPGNVRELENVVQRAFLLSDVDSDAIDLPTAMRVSQQLHAADQDPKTLRAAKQEAVADFEREYARRLLEHTNGNITQAARLAGQDRSAFRRLVRRCGLGAAATVPAKSAES